MIKISSLLTLYGLLVKNPHTNAGDLGSTLGSQRSPKKEMTAHSSILAVEIPWTEQAIVHGITGSGMT